MEDAHAKTSEEVLKFFGTNEEVGLTPDQIKSYQAKYGPNGEWQIYNKYISRSVCMKKEKEFINDAQKTTVLLTPDDEGSV